MYFVYMFCVILISPFILCLFVLWRVEEPVAEDPGVQEVEVAEHELIKGKLCLWPLLLSNNVLYYHLFMHMFNLNGTQ
jgi:Na+/melibiose symporter-like transporter